MRPDDPDLLLSGQDEIAAQEAINGLLQFDRTLNLIEAGLTSGVFSFTPDHIRELQNIAVRDIRRTAGQFRTTPVHIENSSHVPPSDGKVPHLVSELCDYLNRHQSAAIKNLEVGLHLSAYAMWRLNWIHPFDDGNGRTSRALSYLVLCLAMGKILPGDPPIPEQIARNKDPYYHAIDLADAAWRNDELDVSAMATLIEECLEKQLKSALDEL